MYEYRFYRERIRGRYTCEAAYKESDVHIAADVPLNAADVTGLLKRYYTQIEVYAAAHPLFVSSLSALPEDKDAPPIVKAMLCACRYTGVGPFAGVAGAMAHFVGKDIAQRNGDVIVENGGDIFLRISADKIMSVYTGSRFPVEEVRVRVRARDSYFGIASSSAHIGHSLNFGNADLVTVIAQDAILADGFATSLSNRVKSAGDIPGVLKIAQEHDLIYGIVIAAAGKLALWGDIQIAE